MVKQSVVRPSIQNIHGHEEERHVTTAQSSDKMGATRTKRQRLKRYLISLTNNSPELISDKDPTQGDTQVEEAVAEAEAEAKVRLQR